MKVYYLVRIVYNDNLIVDYTEVSAYETLKEAERAMRHLMSSLWSRQNTVVKTGSGYTLFDIDIPVEGLFIKEGWF